MSQAASAGRVYPALLLPVEAISERLAEGGVIVDAIKQGRMKSCCCLA